MGKVLDKKAKKIIMEQISSKLDSDGKITKEEIVELLRPYCSFDVKELREQALRKKANDLIRLHENTFKN